MARIGSAKRPAILRVQSVDRAQQVAQLCNEHGVHFVLRVEPHAVEDLADLERALNPSEPLRAGERVGRNDPCPCGSGRKAKKCCPEATA